MNTVGTIQKMIGEMLIISDCIASIAQSSEETERAIGGVKEIIRKISEIMDVYAYGGFTKRTKMYNVENYILGD